MSNGDSLEQGLLTDVTGSLDRIEERQRDIKMDISKIETHLKEQNGNISHNRMDIAVLSTRLDSGSARTTNLENKFWEIVKASIAPVGIVVLILREFLS